VPALQSNDRSFIGGRATSSELCGVPEGMVLVDELMLVLRREADRTGVLLQVSPRDFMQEMWKRVIAVAAATVLVSVAVGWGD
jgi:hypothetical protein